MNQIYLKIIGKWLKSFIFNNLISFIHRCLPLPIWTTRRDTHRYYQHGATTNGFLEGYNTMDALLAALAFGVTIIRSSKVWGSIKKTQLPKIRSKLALLLCFYVAGFT